MESKKKAMPNGSGHGLAELKRLLRSSPSVKSISSEQQICRLLKKHRWRAVHGGYYIDPKTGKAREADVVARQYWVRPRHNTGLRVHLWFLVETKSAEGFHLLFANSSKPIDGIPRDENWIGSADAAAMAEITKHLASKGVPQHEISSVVKRVEDLAHPNVYALTYKLHCEPPKASRIATAFRETNIGSEKELESSVLWKSFMTLESAVESLRRRTVETIIDDNELVIDYVPEYKLDPVGEIVGNFERHLLILDVFHRVVVIDSKLWFVEGKRLDAMPWCRYLALSPDGQTKWWSDVVRGAEFAEYAATVTEHYRRHFSRLGCKLQQR